MLAEKRDGHQKKSPNHLLVLLYLHSTPAEHPSGGGAAADGSGQGFIGTKKCLRRR